jgi:hypothetical protein
VARANVGFEFAKIAGRPIIETKCTRLLADSFRRASYRFHGTFIPGLPALGIIPLAGEGERMSN